MPAQRATSAEPTTRPMITSTTSKGAAGYTMPSRATTRPSPALWRTKPPQPPFASPGPVAGGKGRARLASARRRRIHGLAAQAANPRQLPAAKALYGSGLAA